MDGDKDKPRPLDYASRERILDTIDLRFWVTLGILVSLLVADISCMVLSASY